MTVAEVAHVLGMSERWVRKQVAEGATHQRYGNRIRFTREQVEALRAPFEVKAPPLLSRITTGPRRHRAL
jgi:excisionase family DNA binding protein